MEQGKTLVELMFVHFQLGKYVNYGHFYKSFSSYNNSKHACLMQENTDHRINEPTIGKLLVGIRGFFKEEYWYWICVAALFGFNLLFNILFTVALTYLNRKQSHPPLL